MPARAKSICASPRRRPGTAASTGSTRPSAPSCSPRRWTSPQMADYIKADSLAFVSIDGLYRALGEDLRDEAQPQHCDACFTGEYPTRLTDHEDLEAPDQLALLAERYADPVTCVGVHFEHRRTRLDATVRRSPMPNSPDQIALVTGASRGIGAATAEALAARGRACRPHRAQRAGLEEVEDGSTRPAAARPSRRWTSPRRDSIARLARGRRSAGTALDILVLNAAMLGSLAPVAQIDGKEFGRVLTLNLLATQALIAALRPAAPQSEAGPSSSPSPPASAAIPALIGAPTELQGRVRNLVAALCRGDPQHLAGPGRHRRSRLDRHPDARSGLSRRGSGERQAARGGRRSGGGAARERFRDGERLEIRSSTGEGRHPVETQVHRARLRWGDVTS